MKEPKEIVRGTLTECFQRWTRDMERRFPKGTKGAEQSRQPMADFCGVSPSTVSRWALGHEMPKGETWFKLVSFLNLLGYRIVEMENVPEINRKVVELITFQIVALEEAQRRLDYATPSGVYSMLRGDNKPLEHKQEIMFALWKQNRGPLEEKKKKLLQELTGMTDRESTDVAGEETASARIENSDDGLTDLITGLIKLLGQPNMVERLRTSPEGKNAVLRLTGRLSELTARLME